MEGQWLILGERRYRGRTARRVQSILRKLLSGVAIAGWVTVLLFLMVPLGTAHPDGDRVRSGKEDTANDLRVFEFTCDVRVPMGHGRLDGVMAAQGAERRIAIYWVEPDLFRESTTFLRYSDFLLTPESVRYWIYGMSQPATLAWSEARRGSLVPQQNSLEPAVRSALAIVSIVRDRGEGTNTPLEVVHFLHEARGREEHAYGASANTQAGDSPDAQILNALPHGREYSLQRQSDGTIVWYVRKTSYRQTVISVRVKPVGLTEEHHHSSPFDPNTLGEWALIPPAYKAYWSFDQAYADLHSGPDVRTAGRGLYEKLVRYLSDSEVPGQVCRALERLRFKIALLTEDMHRIRASAQASVARLCQDNSVGPYECLLELARIGADLAEHCPHQAAEWLRPLVKQAVRHTGAGTLGVLDKLMAYIEANKWFLPGTLLLEEITGQGLPNAEGISVWSAKLEAARVAGDRTPADPCESTATVRQYLTQLDAFPPRGPIDIKAVRSILEEGLARYYPDNNSSVGRGLVENALRSIHLVVGDGPFCGDRAKLVESVEHFAGLYLAIDKVSEPIDAVLATFLALSFCDISTPEDHDILFSQFREQCAQVQAQVNAMLRDRALDTLVTSEDVKATFDPYERIFRRYIDDPLWPAFKFPFTTNEEARLRSRMKLRLMQLTPFLDDMSLKVKYGGTSPELREKTFFEISRAAQELLPQAAFLRNPPYPGVLCKYRGGYGYIAVIKGPLYREGGRPKEKFKAMKYFHLGHRLESVVEHERELVLHPEKEGVQE